MSGVTSSFGYDSNGELTSVTLAGATSTYTYNQSGEMASATDGLGNATFYTYDDNGNQTGTSQLWVDPSNKLPIPWHAHD